MINVQEDCMGLPSEKAANKQSLTDTAKFLTLSDLCQELSISVATGRNWIKLGKLVPTLEEKTSPLFCWDYVLQLKSEIQSGKNAALKSRRNKKYISGNQIYHSYVPDQSVNLPVAQSVIWFLETNSIKVDQSILTAILAHCALQLIFSREHADSLAHDLSDYLQGILPKNAYLFLIDDLVEDKASVEAVLARYPELFTFTYTYEKSEDLLGLLYISLTNIGNRKATGSYYTPTKIVKKLCQQLFEKNSYENKEILDPCCGTGNFLLQLPCDITWEHVFGYDMDPVCLKIARINFALHYCIPDPAVVYAHIAECNYLSSQTDKSFDFMIGNPPWGYHFSKEEQTLLKSKYVTASGSSIESYDVFLEQAIANLKTNGVLSFVLPEAILNVRSHAAIRRLLLDSCSFQYLEYLGNAFDKVQCPCVILQTAYTGRPFDGTGMIVKDQTRKYTIHSPRMWNPECLNFTATDEEFAVLEKISSPSGKTTLAGRAVFALGIVTGDNKKYITQKQTGETEPILKGSDLYKFRWKPSDHYILFKPESFQQVAPVAYYRAEEKLLYRFICSQLVFAYDNQQTLSLNSCNILIPRIKELQIKYILAVLNSRTAQFYFKKRFRSVKVLRSHIEQIPIPSASKLQQDNIIRMVDDIMKVSDPNRLAALYEEIDQEIFILYGLSEKEQQIIRESAAGENMFLSCPLI